MDRQRTGHPRDVPPRGPRLTAPSPSGPPIPPGGSYDFNQRWLFGGRYTAAAEDPRHDDSGFAEITLPHTVSQLGWADWDPRSWEDIWIYRKHFELPAIAGYRAFADFDGIMVNATLVLNGTTVATHQGGYLPFSAELTSALVPGENVLAVITDSRWLPVPPAGAAGGARSIDYLQPGGIYREARLRIVPVAFVADVFTKPAGVLTPDPRVEVHVMVDAGTIQHGPVSVAAELLDGQQRLASTSASADITANGRTSVPLLLAGLGQVGLWSPDSPKLYSVRVTLHAASGQPHSLDVTTGFREARFRSGGFFLNGERLQIFGLNRHQLFPYTGMAAAGRLQRRDAEILRRELNCNMVRCSHYPQSPHFLDACDELGLMVWEEPPGWSYVGARPWQSIAAANMRDMVIRDRNRPSVIVWAARLNETRGHRRLYASTRRLARDLDGTRQTTGAMSRHSARRWDEDVFGYDDYGSADGNAALRPPLPGVPYLVSEAVGAIAGAPRYRWTDPAQVLAWQALLHAQVHAIARSDPRYCGLLGWAFTDYPSLNGAQRIWRALKTAGVLDTFRVPKPAAAFYRSQTDPRIRPVILPAFCWESGPGAAPGGPGPDSMIATNCDRLEIFLDGTYFATGRPDRDRFGSLPYPPVFADLTADGPDLPELRIDGYLADRPVASLAMSADPALDRLTLAADDESIEADGTDTTRLTFRAVDAYGNQRRAVTGIATLRLAGPGLLIGDNPFPFGEYGGTGGGFLRSLPGQTGLAVVTAQHPRLGRCEARVQITPPSAGRRFL
jgi:beta-galactosidase